MTTTIVKELSILTKKQQTMEVPA